MMKKMKKMRMKRLLRPLPPVLLVLLTCLHGPEHPPPQAPLQQERLLLHRLPQQQRQVLSLVAVQVREVHRPQLPPPLFRTLPPSLPQTLRGWLPRWRVQWHQWRLWVLSALRVVPQVLALRSRLT
eukprot:TRINITY_DN45383_c0_g1_i1.p3 TRINITY_DN45383_c0_g1~~TRINITY_DN45383_c0_g1_i1.p3  ORF type:complete len:126 (-),score=19.15 TRINITY_DN45383_c0_g1_i1:400-777(-)